LPDVLFSVEFGYFVICLADKFLRLAGVFLAIFEIFRRKIWRIFVQDLDQCLVHKKLLKSTKLFYPAAKFNCLRMLGCLYHVPAASVQ